ncbi:hypothetical protein Tco_1530308 [Tanacetum coccineum]
MFFDRKRIQPSLYGFHSYYWLDAHVLKLGANVLKAKRLIQILLNWALEKFLSIKETMLYITCGRVVQTVFCHGFTVPTGKSNGLLSPLLNSFKFPILQLLQLNAERDVLKSIIEAQKVLYSRKCNTPSEILEFKYNRNIAIGKKLANQAGLFYVKYHHNIHVKVPWMKKLLPLKAVGFRSLIAYCLINFLSFSPTATADRRWQSATELFSLSAAVFDEELMKYQHVEEEIVHMLQLGLACMARVHDMRPSIDDFIKMIADLSKASTSGTRVENVSLYEQWKEIYEDDPYDDVAFDSLGLTKEQTAYANINLRGQIKEVFSVVVYKFGLLFL